MMGEKRVSITVPKSSSSSALQETNMLNQVKRTSSLKKSFQDSIAKQTSKRLSLKNTKSIQDARNSIAKKVSTSSSSTSKSKELEESLKKQELEHEEQMEDLKSWAQKALAQVKKLESEKAALQDEVNMYKDEIERNSTAVSPSTWWRNRKGLLTPEQELQQKYEALFREKMQMEEDLNAMINDRDEKITTLRREQQRMQQQQNLSPEQCKEQFEKAQKATNGLRDEVDISVLKINKVQNVVEDSMFRLTEILDTLREREECPDEESAMVLALGESLSLLQEHVRISLLLLNQKVTNRLDSVLLGNKDSIVDDDKLFQGVRIEVMDLIRKADLELNEKIKYLEDEIDKLKEC